MGVISAKLIAETLIQNGEFIKLELGKNNLADDGIQAIAYLVGQNKNFIHLDVSSNNLTEAGVKSLADALMANNTLISLSLKSFEGLNRNKVGPKGCGHLKKLLTKTKVPPDNRDPDVPEPLRSPDHAPGPQAHLRRAQNERVAALARHQQQLPRPECQQVPRRHALGLLSRRTQPRE